MPEQKLDVKISTTADVSGANQATKALDGTASAAGRAGKASVTFLNSSIQDSAKAGKALDDLKRSGEDVSKVFSGIQQSSSGGLSGLLGMARAAQGLRGVLASISAGGVGGLTVGLGALGGALVGVGKLFLESREKINAARDGLNLTTKSADEFGKELVDLQKQSKESLEAQLADVKRLADGYSDLLKRIDAAEKRATKQNALATDNALAQVNLEEKKALAGAKTDEARAKIEQQFASRRQGIQNKAQDAELENRGLSAQVRSDRASEAISGARSAIAAAETEAALKTRDKALAGETLLAATTGVREASTPLERNRAARDLDEAAAGFRNARKAETAALDNVTKVTIEANQVITNAEEQIGAAQETRQDTATEKKTVSTQRAADSITVGPILSEPSTERTDTLRAELKAANDARDRDRTFGGDPKLNEMVSKLTSAVAESSEADSKVLSAFTAQVQASAASRRKLGREMEKANTRANDNR